MMEILLTIEDAETGIEIYSTFAACVPASGECVSGWDEFTYRIIGVNYRLNKSPLQRATISVSKTSI